MRELFRFKLSVLESVSSRNNISVPRHVNESERYRDQSRCENPRSSVGGIVGLWENAEENQPLIISLTHSLLIEMRAILIIQEAKYKLVYLTRLFIASLTLRLHSTEQCIHKHNTNYTIEKYIYAQKNYTMQIK